MRKRFCRTAALALFALAAVLAPARAQQIPTCPTAPIGDSSNRCASTQFVQQNAGPGGGGINSIGLIMPNIFSVSTPNPILPPSGTFTVTLGNQSANTVFAGPTTGAAAAPGFRNLVTADLPAGTGTVTSVGLSLPGIFNVTVPTVTTSGTLSAVFNAQGANSFFAGPTPSFRTIALGDLPAIPNSTVYGNFGGSTVPPSAANVPTCQSDGSHFLTNNAGSGFNCTALASAAVASVTATNGTLTISPTTGAVSAALNLGNANTWTAAQTFNNSDIKLLGSSTGATTFTSANSSASNFTITIPATTDTLVTLAATQTLTNKSLDGGEINSGQVALANGGTNAALTASNGGIFYSTATAGAILAGTGSANLCLLSGSNAAPSWGTCPGASTVSNSDGTLTISPTSGAVVASLALGHANTWTAAQTFNNSDILLLGSSTGATTFTSANAGASNFTLTFPAATDTVVTLAATQTLTNKSIAGSEINSGLVALSVGGTNANLTASNGGIFYSTASAGAILAGTVTAGQCLLSGSNAAPTWGSCSGAAAVSSVSNSDGTLTISPTTGAVIASLALGHANTWTAAQTFNNSDILLLGSSTGATTFTSANAGASNFTLTFPAATDTVVTLAATQTLTNKSIAGSEINSGLVGLSVGGTNANLTASNGGIFYSTASAGAILAGTVTAGQCLLSGSNAAPTWSTCPGGVSSVTATNGTLTISPTTGAVLAALNLGNANTWTAAQTFTNSDILLLGSSTGATTFTSANASASNFTLTFPATTDTLVTLAATQTLTNKSIAGGEINSGQVALANGGTNANLTASNGGIFYSTATAGAILAGTATANQMLLSGASAAPVWSTATHPATTVANQLLYSSATNTIAGLATAANGVLITSAGSVPSISSTLPTAVQGNITSTGTITSGTWNGTTITVTNGGTGATTFTANLPLIGNGTAAIAQGSLSGSTTTFGTTTGTLTSGHCVSIDASGNLMDAGAACSSGGTTTIIPPQGRLTLTANTPVMTASATAQTTLRYDCSVGNSVPYYTGSADALDTIASCEVTDAMVSAASAGQVVSANVYDVWWVHAGSNRICLAMSASTGGGGGWSADTGGSNTARGTGYSQLDVTTRPYITNKNAITNCFNGATNYGSVSANQATYLGTVCSDAAANGVVSYTFGGSGASGVAARLCVWNQYNRIPVSTMVQDSTSAYSYVTAAWRAADASNSMRVTYVYGQNEEPAYCFYQSNVGRAASGASALLAAVGCGVDATNAVSGVTSAQGYSFATAQNQEELHARYQGYPGAGSHFLQALEWGQANAVFNTTTAPGATGLQVELRM